MSNFVSGTYPNIIDNIVRKYRTRNDAQDQREKREKEVEEAKSRGVRYYSLKLPIEDKPRLWELKALVMGRTGKNLTNVELCSLMMDHAIEVERALIEGLSE